MNIMNDTYNHALKPARILLKPAADKYQDSHRKWQGIPSIERTEGGTIYSIFYSGNTGETAGNFAVMLRSDDKGNSFSSPYIVVEHEHPNVRVFDPNLWLDPLGRLWMTWAQSWDFFDGRAGVWCAICEKPDEEPIRFYEPFRIFDGVMMNKPIVLKNGKWLFPCAIWRKELAVSAAKQCITPRTDENIIYSAYEEGAYALETDDCGKSFTPLGYAKFTNYDFPEHMFIEMKDSRIWCLARTINHIAQSFSCDGGRTWSEEEVSNLYGGGSRFFIRRLNSGALLFVGHANILFDKPGENKSPNRRANLTAMLSYDDGKTWDPNVLLLDDRENVSYPDGTQDDNGIIYIIYDRGRYAEREILLARFTEENIRSKRTDKNLSLRQVINTAYGV
jgi:hypothetical protein